MRSNPAIAAIGTVASTAARPRSAAIRIGRRRRRSTHTPAISPMRKAGSRRAAASAPSWNGVALRTRMAVKSIAAPPIIEPNTEMVWPPQRRMKSGLRQSPANFCPVII